MPPRQLGALRHAEALRTNAKHVRRTGPNRGGPLSYPSAFFYACRLTCAMLLLITGAAHVVPAAAQATPNLVGAASRKMHGAAGTLDLALALTPGKPTNE